MPLSEREAAGDVRLVVLPRQPRTNPIFARSDIDVARNLLQLSIASRRQSETWPEVCRAMARRDIAASKDGDRSIAQRIARAIGIANDEARAIAESARALRHESILQVVRWLLPGRWDPKIVLEGRDHLDAILAHGKGAVLWMAHFVFAGSVVKMAVYGAGYPLAHFSRPEHGFSRRVSAWPCSIRFECHLRIGTFLAGWSIDGSNRPQRCRPCGNSWRKTASSP